MEVVRCCSRARTTARAAARARATVRVTPWAPCKSRWKAPRTCWHGSGADYNRRVPCYVQISCDHLKRPLTACPSAFYAVRTWARRSVATPSASLPSLPSRACPFPRRGTVVRLSEPASVSWQPVHEPAPCNVSFLAARSHMQLDCSEGVVQRGRAMLPRYPRSRLGRSDAGPHRHTCDGPERVETAGEPLATLTTAALRPPVLSYPTPRTLTQPPSKPARQIR